MSYAAKTEVPIERSKAEIETVVARYGAQQFLSGWSNDGSALIGFTMKDRQVKFLLRLPDKADDRFTQHSKGPRSATAAHDLWEQACRQKWRALGLVIKAKLEAVDAGISIFEDEFLANIVLPNGNLVGQEIRPRIAQAYDSGTMPPLLPDYSS
jgi:hypothetical protein